MALQKQNSSTSRNAPPLSAAVAPLDIDSLRGQAATLLIEFQDKLEKTLHVFKLKAAKQIASELPKISEELLARSSEEYRKFTEETAEKLQQELKAAEVEANERTRKRFTMLGEDSVNAFVVEAKTASEKLLGEMTGSLKEQGQTVSRDVDAVLRSVRTAGEEATAKLQVAWEQMDSSLRADHEKRLAALSASGLKELERKAETSLEAFQEQLEGALATFKRKASARIEEDISKSAAALLDRSTGQLQQQTEEARERMLVELQNSGNALLASARQQFENLQKAAVDLLKQSAGVAAEKEVREAAENVQQQIQAAMSRNADATFARLDAERQKLETQAERSVADHSKQLHQRAVEGIEGVQRQLESQLDAFRRQLDSSAQALGQKALEKATSEFPRVAAQLMEGALADFEKKAGEAAEKVRGEIRSSSAGLAQEVGRRAIGDAEDTLRSLRESTLDQAKNQIRQLFKELTSVNRKEFEGEIEESIRKQRKSAQAQIDEMSRASLERLRQAAPQVAAMPTQSPSAGKFLLVIVALLPTVLFLYLMGRPVMRLKADPPAEFLNAYPEWTGQHPEVATRLGEAYWDWAAVHLTREYPYGTDLPEQPPILFKVEGEGFPSGVDADVARLRYWQKLRELWKNPQSWDKVEVWNLK